MDNQSVTPRAAKLLTIDLGTDLKSRWFQWCAERQLVPGKALKSLLEQTLKHGLGAAEMPSPPVPAVKVGASPDARSKVVYKAYTPPFAAKERVVRASTQPKFGHEIYFTATEYHALLTVAAAQGFGLHEFVIAAVRAALAQMPTFGQAELEALTRSNAALVNVVAGLVALKSAMNDATIAQQFASLENDVRSHIETASRLMAVGTRRWQLKV